ncbi:Positive regulator of L-idonate catabolism [Candidatus Rhodobacter oscarellae]|uniref:Positive regulator of L-idonate catabolism n=1 Tax=Candidatus Rhodobacter oscarellae TaxID=1675527 RepID=A0A0J9GYE4_9RHOB|nr:substrate-binding domain-containing protein [Candidatus Rhodobacter lobularis]KMW58498.1 Positive regulator of L-idonate catabolism [Candidatus Rhodobacter lobularis]
MAAPVTMRDVADAAGVSPMTVSRALRDDASVKPETRRRIRETADRLGYVYASTARAFRSGQSGFVAVTLPSINNANFAETHSGLLDAFSETGLQVLLGITGYSVAEEERLVRELVKRQPEAIVLTGGRHTAATQQLVSALSIPTLEIWDQPEAPLEHVVGFSNAAAMGELVRHLAGQGRRRIGFLGAEAGSDLRGDARRMGAVRAAQEFGLPEIREIKIGPAPVSMTQSAEAVARMGASLDALDALICVSDPVAYGALSACQRLGVAVPEALAVTGFGGFEIAAVSHPRLTTVNVNAYAIGAQAGQLILEALRGEAREARRIDTGYRLVAGETS